MPSKEFYVYVHRRVTDNSVFYVGKGHANRAWAKNSRNQHWQNIVSKHGYIVEIVKYGMQEWWAMEFEIELIAQYGRQTLCNRTDGGDGFSGFIPTAENRINMGRAHIGNKYNLGRKMSEELKTRLSIINTGRKHAPEHGAKISAANKGRKHSPEFSEKLRVANLGKRHKKESLIKMSNSKLGNTHKRGKSPSKETLIKMVECQKKVSIQTVCGKVFESVNSARRWLNRNGFPRASNGGLSKALLDSSKKVYGTQWSYIDRNNLFE